MTPAAPSQPPCFYARLKEGRHYGVRFRRDQLYDAVIEMLMLGGDRNTPEFTERDSLALVRYTLNDLAE